jgi:predicted ribosome quality control (RQC) complex YloA/Tae2 family protein
VAKISPLLEAFHEMLMPVWEHRWQPSIAKRDDRLVAFAPYPLTQYGDWKEVESISQAVEAYHGQMVGEDAYAAAKRGAREAIVRARERMRRKQEALERSRVSQAQVEELRRQGEMILAYAHRIEPGQRDLAAPVGPDEPPLLIELNPALPPAENAQRYFERYRKAKSAAGEIPALLQRAELEMRYLDQLETDLDLAANRPEIREVEACLVEAGYIREKRRRGKVGHSQPLAVTSGDGLLILVGKNSRQNEEVTFRRAAPHDLWLHVRGAPGAHVIVKTEGREVPEATLRQAAQLAAYYSQARGSARVAVDYTERRYVRSIKRAGPGLVTYTRQKTIRVAPQRPAFSIPP